VSNTIHFSRSLYLTEAVEAAVAAYSEVATFDVQSDESEIAVQIEADAGYGDTVYHAFCNHVLFESIVRTRQALGGRLT
jgi:hypothetical protein